MTTRPYSDCLAQALALCGVPDANATEVARVKTFINRRARQAYAESELWPRWLVVGEERMVSEDGLLPYEEDGLQDIGTIQRIHESQPFVSDPAGEYVDWTSQSDGIQITGYQPNSTSGIQYVVTGSLNPDLTGVYEYSSTDSGPFPNVRFVSTSNATHLLAGVYDTGVSGVDSWLLVRTTDISGWESGSGVSTPEQAATWTPLGSQTGTPVVTAESTNTAFITYKAAFSTTYGTGEGEEDEVPEEWFEWMATGAAASFLFSDKEAEQALLLEAQAREDLDQQLAKISRQNGNKVQTRILSHGNMQAR